MTAGLIVLLVVAAMVLITLGRTVRIVPQARAGVVERLGRYSRTLSPGLAIVDSRTHGYVKPHPTIFQAALGLLRVAAPDAVMVGDSLEEDIEGARALGMRAILVDREDRHPDVDGRLADLYALPAALGLSRPP